MQEKGNDVIPITTYEKIKNNGGRFPEGVAEKIRYGIDLPSDSPSKIKKK